MTRCTFTAVVFVTLSLTLVGGSTDSGTNGSTTGHTNDSASITATPATRQTSHCRA